ncbi:conserved hypothetical protein [Caldicellulosiruptor hydrothermalis 108]|uniref:Uncharacterized protein n=1 Tax=Caldicellulosiruptor hydrothermalis (strain DSM 18901 / VKM B-2411 / 108) TaxID=632292 RepID=E4QC07_CALH1|nr:hypothetical protein [Caldicellulosiruptor hydrothermalis]ADQ06181.1 conserved hypothetical protein [Caldicellulosiruptor hydrothermalis 108]
MDYVKVFEKGSFNEVHITKLNLDELRILRTDLTIILSKINFYLNYGVYPEYPTKKYTIRVLRNDVFVPRKNADQQIVKEQLTELIKYIDWRIQDMELDLQEQEKERKTA